LVRRWRLKAIDVKHPGLEIIPSTSFGGTDGIYCRAAGISSYGVSGSYRKNNNSFSRGLNECVFVEGYLR
ncbi:MAG: carboxypeptidase PM20D1, partial [Porticoccaceae bacterium]